MKAKGLGWHYGSRITDNGDMVIPMFKPNGFVGVQRIFFDETLTFTHDEEKQLAEVRKLTGETRLEFLKRMIANGVKVEIERLKEREGKLGW